MTNRGFLLLCTGLVLLGGALVALHFPVYLDVWDKYGWQVSCGNGYSSDLAQAQRADLVAQCQSALAVRRGWTIPLAAVGGLILTGIGVALFHHAAPASAHEVATDESHSGHQ